MTPLEASPRFKAIFLVLGFAPLVAIAIVGARHSGIIPALTRDPVAIAGLHPLTGLLSTLGLLVWSATAAIWLCVWIVANARGARQIARLARWSGILTCWLAFDDGFQFHEYLAPRLFQIGEKTALAALLFAVFLYLAGFRAQLAHGTYRLAWSLALLSTSVAIDALPEAFVSGLGPWEFFLEDGLKWAGIVGWLASALGSFRRALTAGTPQQKVSRPA